MATRNKFIVNGGLTENAGFKVQLSADGSGNYVDVVGLDGTSINVDTLNVGTVDSTYNSTPPTLTNGETVSLQGDSAGNLKMSEVPIMGASAITPNDVSTVSAGRQFLVNCTVTGNVKVAFSNTSTLTIPVSVGLMLLPWAIIQVFVTGTTATATYANLS